MNIQQLSLLDKLIDQDPDHLVEKNKTQQQILSDLYHSIHRDLENLLNTRNNGLDFSPFNYGLPDLFNHPVFLHDQTAFIQKLRGIIEIFEPRLRNIEISLLPHDDLLERTLRFRITGWLNVDSTPALMTLDSTLNPENYSFQLTPA